MSCLRLYHEELKVERNHCALTIIIQELYQSRSEVG